jgi:N-acetylneuraminic acid mutarotase
MQQQAKWEKKADMPTENYCLKAVEIDGKIYVAGGVGNNFALISQTAVYDPQKDIWENKTGMNILRCDHNLEVVNGKIYAIGGQTCCPNWVYVTEEYDPVKDEWTKLKNIPVSRYCSASTVENEIIYIIGGWDNMTALADVYSYNPANEIWKRQADLPVGGRWYGKACSINGKIYFMGGSSSGNSSVPTADVLEYDPDIDKWIRKTDMPIPRVGHQLAVFNGKIYVIGGFSGWNNGGMATVIDIYDPEKDSWIEQTPNPNVRSFFELVVIENKFYLMGGSPLCDGWNIPPL